MVQPERRKGEAGAGNVRLRQLLGGLCSKRELRTGETAGCRRQEFFVFVFEGGEITAQKETFWCWGEKGWDGWSGIQGQGAQDNLWPKWRRWSPIGMRSMRSTRHPSAGNQDPRPRGKSEGESGKKVSSDPSD